MTLISNVATEFGPFFQDNRLNGPVREIEFQVSSVLNRLEAAVEKFETNNTFSVLDSKQLSTLIPRSSREIIEVIEVNSF